MIRRKGLESKRSKIGAAFTYFLAAASILPAQQRGTWSFAVSGDSRNCGDVVMPEIAAKVQQDGAAFYWHLGDFRALYDFDQDMLAANHEKLTIAEYEDRAWQDFIDQQLTPFGRTPVYLAVGNHELVSKTRLELLVQFADWFDSSPIRSQRLADDPASHALHTYYHWHERNVDFITMDNGSADQFNADQLAWFHKVLARDAADGSIRTVVVGMHDALPDSLSAGHSMNESLQGTRSGRIVYDDLLSFRDRTRKEVHVLASHSHFVLSDPYKTSCRMPGQVLSGWIVGTAGATRYRLPANHSAAGFAETDVYGYLLAKVSPEGHITFSFRRISEPEIPASTEARYGKHLIEQCFAENKGSYVPEGPTCPADSDQSK